MRTTLPVEILPQPDETTCGPTCLHTVYRFFDDDIPLDTVINEVNKLDEGGTLGVFLGCHALKRGYKATIYSYNLQVFDPTWFGKGIPFIIDRLYRQLEVKTDSKLLLATKGYIEFLELGGKVKFEDLNAALIRKFVKRNQPILTGLSATYLYRSAREYGPHAEFDDIRGEPSGHFVILHGYDKIERKVFVSDPLKLNPLGLGHQYEVSIDRVICAIMLGILTYDANLLVVRPHE